MASRTWSELAHPAAEGSDPGASERVAGANSAGPKLMLRVEAERRSDDARAPEPASAGGETVAMEEGENLRLLRWARREAPEMIEILRTAYLSGAGGLPALLTAAYNRVVRPAPAAPPDIAAGPDAGHAMKLRDVERDHLRKVLAESSTVTEAARRLGIDVATLWRKRKRYRLIDGPDRPA